MTLGIYSPWAKVRKLKYLYGHSHIGEGSFDYHAKPFTILKGRVVAFGLLVIYAVVGTVYPGWEGLLGVAILLLLPFLIVRSRRFNLVNTSYRNVRMGFAPVYGDAYKVILGYGLLGVLSLGLAWPWVRLQRSRLLANNTTYGELQFSMPPDIGASAFYRAYGIAALIILPCALIGGLLGVSLGVGSGGPGLVVLPAVFVFIAVVTGLFYLQNRVLKLVLSGLQIGEHKVLCDWNIFTLVMIQVTNLLAIALSVGLLIPWATVRVQRYMLDHLRLEVSGSLDDVVAVQVEYESALGDEIGEAFDYDLGF